MSKALSLEWQQTAARLLEPLWTNGVDRAHSQQLLHNRSGNPLTRFRVRRGHILRKHTYPRLGVPIVSIQKRPNRSWRTHASGVWKMVMLDRHGFWTIWPPSLHML